MLGDAWQGKVTDILDWVAEAGYEGIEITNTMIREFADRPEDFAAELKARGLELAAFAYARPSGFTDPDVEAEDMEGAKQAVEFIYHFPQAQLALAGAASPSREDAHAKLDRAINFYNQVGYYANAQLVRVNVHPHSHYGSLLETADEYQRLVDGLARCCVNFGPDTGHIVRGGQDLLTCLRTHIGRITHLHLKDANAGREWVPLGEGLCDFPGVFRILEEADYSGWVVAEEESPFARQDGRAAIRRNREYLKSIGY
jgi:sugar phosphate isomerase/epimerase